MCSPAYKGHDDLTSSPFHSPNQKKSDFINKIKIQIQDNTLKDSLRFLQSAVRIFLRRILKTSYVAIANEGFVRYVLSHHISKHGLTTAMQHLVEAGKVFRGVSN